ncbi:MAG TPA: LysR family transcriptional regulator [Victivallales bacterium]|nr:LysR family transcriptional regulator [Victivallales bacterium]
MSLAKLINVNLNLLVVLDVLLTVKNTTRAAERLKLSQSTVSYSLKQLRNIFDDELLIRGYFSNEMTLTPKAELLIGPVRKALERFEDIFTENEFNPAKVTRSYNIAMSDFSTVLLLPGIIEKLKEIGPNITVDVTTINYNRFFYELDSNNIDMAIGTEIYDAPANIMSELLFKERIVCIADKNHPIFSKDKLTVDEFKNYRHLIWNYRFEGWKTIFGKKMNSKIYPINSKNFTVPHMIAALSILPGTDFICIGSERMSKKFAGIYNLAYRTLPFEFPELTYFMWWRKKHNDDPAITWMISLIKKVCFNI